MINIRLPDGAVKTFPGPVTVAEVAQSIGPGLAKAALAGRVDGKLVDTSCRLERDGDLAIVTDKDKDGLEILRHSTAHLLAYAVKEIFPDAQVTIGPVIENGFYYDFSYKRPFTPEDLAAIEKRMAELAKRDLPVDGFFVAIGHRPNTAPFEGWLAKDEKGYLVVEHETHSQIEGVFIAGDVHDHRYRQAVTAAGDGCRAAIDAERWLEEHGVVEAVTATAW